ncbi:hypothetical protein JCM14076_32110 [Methylosoma difficile]
METEGGMGFACVYDQLGRVVNGSVLKNYHANLGINQVAKPLIDSGYHLNLRLNRTAIC